MKFLIFLLAIFSSSKAITINCPFGFYSLVTPPFPSSYACYRPTLGNISDGEELTAVYGNHQSGYSNNDVILLQFYCQNPSNLNFFPREIHKFFPNLKALSFYYCNITALHGDELDSLKNLTLFEYDFSYSLQRIPPNFFQNTPLIDSICLYQNSLTHFGVAVFDHLNSLTFMNLRNNYCVSQGANNRDQVLALIDFVKDNCTDIEIEEPSCGDMHEIICNLEEQNQEIKSKLQEISLENYEIKGHLTELSIENVQIKGMLTDMAAKNTEMNEKLGELSQENAQIKQLLNELLDKIIELYHPCAL